jgi:type IV secretion system protein VirB9
MKNIALTPTAADAVALAKMLVNERNTPTPTADGRVVYLYGVGLPTIVCAPLRVCSLELQAGEHILGEPQIGDSVRWEVSPAISGVDANAIPILVLKPKMTGLDTTMLILTDKRTYYIRLISKPEEFIARTAFSYSDDEHVQWKVFLAEQERLRSERVASSQVAVTATGAIDKLYFDYTIKPGKGSARIVPDRVMDDGEKTYIQMPEVAMYRELPALVIQGPTGKEMVNYRVKDNTYIVDRLFDRAALLMGSGRHQQIVKLVRKQPLAGGEK